MGKLVQAVLGAILTLLIVSGGPLVWWADHHFAGWSAKVGPKLPLIPCCQVTLSLPPGLAVAAARKLAEADSQISAAQAQVKVLTASLAAQNASVEALSRQGALARADLVSAKDRYIRDLAKAKRPAELILAADTGPGNVCSRAAAVDVAFLASIR